MGWCHEFGLEIESLCSHPMVAGRTSCACPDCGTVCPGRFEAGCESVWKRGPRLDAPERPNYDTKGGLQLIGASAAVPIGVPVNGSHANGGQVHGATDDGAQSNGAHGNGAEPTFAGARTVPANGTTPTIDDLAHQVARLEKSLSVLTEQVATQSRLRASTERHVADLGQVLGQLGLDVDDRLALIELVLDELGARPSQQPEAGADLAEPAPPADLFLPSAEPAGDPTPPEDLYLPSAEPAGEPASPDDLYLPSAEPAGEPASPDDLYLPSPADDPARSGVRFLPAAAPAGEWR